MSHNKCYILFALFLFLGASCQKHLTRDNARSLISKSRHHPVKKNYKITKTYIKNMDTRGRGVSIIIGEDESLENEKIYKQFEIKGLLNLEETQESKETTSFLIGTTIRTWTKIDVKLTESGKKYLVGEDPDNYLVNLWETDIKDITGIRELDDKKSAIADYTVFNKNITPFGEIFNDKHQVTQHTAYFFFYDDGWRIDD